MAYKLNETGTRVFLNVLANADKSLIGLEVFNSRVFVMDYSELERIVVTISGVREQGNLRSNLSKHHAFFPFLRTDNTERVIVMETITDSINGPAEPQTILEMLKLYQSSEIFSCYYLSYRVKEHKTVWGGITYNPLNYRFNHEHVLYFPTKPYVMTDEDLRVFPIWMESHIIILNETNQNDKYKQIVRLYLNSYLLGDISQSFIMLSIVLEMVFGGSQELSYRISRGAGFFLSTNREEMRTVYKEVKKLYVLRSKYIHEGKSIDEEKLYELREIVRRIIVRMYEKNMHVSSYNYNAFLDEITYDGYPTSE